MANTNLSIFGFNDKQIRFEKRGEFIWVSLTDMAKANGKLTADYMRLNSTTEFLAELESIMGFPIMVSNVGGKPETTGTWAIDEVAIDFAQWCNVKFRIWVNRQIKTLLTDGAVSLVKPPPAPLPPAEIRVHNLVEDLKFLDIDVHNPRFKQG
jgi:hypothetical protein